MARRIDPIPEVEKAEKVRYLQAVENLLGHNWLEGPGVHPMRSLWKRRDFIATTELLTFGYALVRIAEATPQKTLRRTARELKGTDRGNRTGAALELLAASMFHRQNHPVTMARPNEPGYDFSVAVPGGTALRVSCKALVSSAHEQNFLRFCSEVYSELATVLSSNDQVVVFMELVREKKTERSFDSRGLVTALKQYHEQWKQGKIVGFGFHGWGVVFFPLGGYPDKELSTKEPSYTLICKSPFLGPEQKRFSDKVMEARNNLLKARPVDPDRNANVILLKIPTSVSLAEAKDFVNGLWDPSMDHVGAVFVYRTQMCTSQDTSQTYLNYEHTWLSNPDPQLSFNRVLPGGFSINLAVPIGQSSTTEAKYQLRVGEVWLDFSAGYRFLRGRHVFHAKKKTGKNLKIQFHRYPGIQPIYVVEGLGDGLTKFEPIFPPSDDLFLI